MRGDCQCDELSSIDKEVHTAYPYLVSYNVLGFLQRSRNDLNMLNCDEEGVLSGKFGIDGKSDSKNAKRRGEYPSFF